MDNSCKTVTDENSGAFIDSECTITHNGKSYTQGGAWMMKRKDTGKFEGRVYHTEKNGRHFVQNWDGSFEVPAIVGRMWRSNMGDRRQSVWFKWNNRYFHGVHCSIDWTELFSAKETKPW